MSHPIIDYSIANNLQLECWLDCTDSNYRTIIGNTFTLLNRVDNTDYDFIQNNPSYHPTINFDSLSFIGSQHLLPRSNNFFYQLNKYSCLFIFKQVIDDNQYFISLQKSNNSLPNYLDYYYSDNSLQQQFSGLNIENKLSFDTSSIDTVSIFGISHDIFIGKTNVVTNTEPSNLKANLDLGYILNNFPDKFILGNSISLNQSFRNNLLHVLFFKEYCSKSDIDFISTYLYPIGQVIENDFRDDGINATCFIKSNLISNLVNATTPVRKQPNNNISTYNVLNFPLTFILSLNYSWDSINENRWNTIVESQWNNIL